MTKEESLEKELDYVLKNFKENLLIVYEYKKKRAQNVNELLEDYLCVAKEFELNLKKSSQYNSQIEVGIHYDISEKVDTLPENIQKLVDKKIKN